MFLGNFGEAAVAEGPDVRSGAAQDCFWAHAELVEQVRSEVMAARVARMEVAAVKLDDSAGAARVLQVQKSD
jgi:hypothetical protein